MAEAKRGGRAGGKKTVKEGKQVETPEARRGEGMRKKETGSPPPFTLVLKSPSSLLKSLQPPAFTQELIS